jgi:hypothetical protein
MAGQFAKKTTVPSDQTRVEIERALRRYGASAFGYLSQVGAEVILFELRGRRIRYVMPMPDPESEEITRTPEGRHRSSQARTAALDQAIRQRWRALLLIITAKLEAVASGVVSLEEEFLPWTIVPAGEGRSATVAEWLEPQVREAYRTGAVPALLPGVELPALGEGR